MSHIAHDCPTCGHVHLSPDDFEVVKKAMDLCQDDIGREVSVESGPAHARTIYTDELIGLSFGVVRHFPNSVREPKTTLYFKRTRWPRPGGLITQGTGEDMGLTVEDDARVTVRFAACRNKEVAP